MAEVLDIKKDTVVEDIEKLYEQAEEKGLFDMARFLYEHQKCDYNEILVRDYREFVHSRYTASNHRIGRIKSYLMITKEVIDVYRKKGIISDKCDGYLSRKTKRYICQLIDINAPFLSKEHFDRQAKLLGISIKKDLAKPLNDYQGLTPREQLALFLYEYQKVHVNAARLKEYNARGLKESVSISPATLYTYCNCAIKDLHDIETHNFSENEHQAYLPNDLYNAVIRFWKDGAKFLPSNPIETQKPGKKVETQAKEKTVEIPVEVKSKEFKSIEVKGSDLDAVIALEEKCKKADKLKDRIEKILFIIKCEEESGVLDELSSNLECAKDILCLITGKKSMVKDRDALFSCFLSLLATNKFDYSTRLELVDKISNMFKDLK